MQRYNPKEIEPRWQKKWAADKLYEVREEPGRVKSYVTAMFPYPSGAGLHVGHVRNYSITDAIARFERQNGKNVLSTIGWDGFGLPAENYAIKTGTPPAVSTAQNIKNFKAQLERLGMSYDWSRELNTTDPSYYKWTQYLFLKLFEQGLAYQKESLQWWCPHDKTVLANEQVEAGRCWRCGHEVVKKSMKQWFFRITDYADELLEAIPDLEWPEKIKTMQTNWIGKSKGAEIRFAVSRHPELDSGSSSEMGKIPNQVRNDAGSKHITVFTTRPDTIFGATFLVLAPEHPLIGQLTSESQKPEVKSYVDAAVKKSEVERQESKEKTGVFTGAYAINPATKEKIPIWVADYVLMGYGTGAIMAVPAHDERDNEFARKFDLPVIEIVAPDFGKKLLDTVDVTGPVVVGYDPKIKKYMSLINMKNDVRWFAAGGLEDGETYEQAALRELGEEAGYHDVKKLIQLGGPTYSYYFNSNKNSNRRSFSYMFLAIIDSGEKIEQHLESHEKYRVVWSDAAPIMTDLEKDLDDCAHWVDGMIRAQDAVAAYEHGKEYVGPIITGEGVLFNSGKYDGMGTSEAREKIVADLASQGVVSEKTNYKMRDWLISRQRYWGAPIPIIHCPKDGAVAVPEDQLPVLLPEVDNYEPDGSGKGVLGRATDWVNVSCPQCGGPAQRETDTMDGYVCSSWYLFRYADAHNTKAPWDPAKVNYWAPLDFYCGGDHAVAHLLYVRFWTRVFQRLGMLDFKEPITRLVYNGYIYAADGTKMSKSKGNVVDPLEVVNSGYGADALRMYELFCGPYEQDAAWDPGGVAGTFRFLNRLWTLAGEFADANSESRVKSQESRELLRAVHRTIKKVSFDLGQLSFNTAIAALMECVNDLYKLKAADEFAAGEWRWALKSLTQLVAPFAPHIAEELWQQLGGEGSVHVAMWPAYDDKYLAEDTVTIAVQVNGKLRGTVAASKGSDQAAASALARADAKITAHLDGREVVKTIYVPDKLLSFVVK